MRAAGVGVRARLVEGALPRLAGKHALGLEAAGAGERTECVVRFSWLVERSVVPTFTLGTSGLCAPRGGAETPARSAWRADLAQRVAVERDILAALERPHITHFYDAGVSDDGAPCLALESVAGRSLLRWADERRADARERTELFLQVLQAVQYAHEQHNTRRGRPGRAPHRRRRQWRSASRSR